MSLIQAATRAKANEDDLLPKPERLRLAEPDPGRPGEGAVAGANVRDQARRLLLSTTFSRLGSRGWEFAGPLLLLEWSPDSLAAPALFGLTNALCRAMVSPWLGERADGWDRLSTVLAGTAMQALGCFLSVGALSALLIYSAFSSSTADGSDLVPFLSLGLVIVAGATEALGAQLSWVAVKKEWVPIVFNEENSHPAQKRSGAVFSFLCLDSYFPAINLTFINTAMTNIDLLAAMFGPILAGWTLQAMGGGDGIYSRHTAHSGFLAISLMNIVSFVPEALLLRRVYLSCPALQQPRGEGVNSSGNGGSSGSEATETEPAQKKGGRNPWSTWFHHPSGLPLLTVSLASLYLTALSPAGVVLTAYLVTIGTSPEAIGVFRATGALSGMAGITIFSLARNRRRGRGNGMEDTPRSSSANSIERLRWISLTFIVIEVVSVLISAFAFFLYEALLALEPRDSLTPPWQIGLFLGALCVSRAGLYAFDIGALEIEQHIVDERYRNAVGSVEGALCSSAEVGIYLLSLFLSDPSDFGWQVGISAAAVTVGGVCFGIFVACYKMHGHRHDEKDDSEIFEDGQSHSHSHNYPHPHTLQQEQDLREHHGYHIHLYRRHSSAC